MRIAYAAAPATAPRDGAAPEGWAALFMGTNRRANGIASGMTSATLDDDWLASQPEPAGGDEFQCLATAVYFEARGESIKGQAAVAEVVLNRAETPGFPRSICGVVHQRGGGGCQFSFTCDGIKDRIREPEAWDRATRIAAAMMAGLPRTLTDGATYFHTLSVRPSWARRFEKTARIGDHVFYRAPIRTAMN